MYEDTYLEHHGIKGQKWGIRRFQNQDGSLTNKGRKRYELTDGQKKALKMGALVAGSILAAAGGLYLYKSGIAGRVINSGSIKRGKDAIKSIFGKKKTMITIPNNKPQIATTSKAVQKTIETTTAPKQAITKSASITSKVSNSIKEVSSEPKNIPISPAKTSSIKLEFGTNDSVSVSNEQLMKNLSKLSRISTNSVNQANIDYGEDFARGLLSKNMRSLGF